jgi:cytochrome d ubiquinol oxidase subunit I
VTEVGRQPWIVYDVMRTKDGVTGASGVWVTFSATLAIYTVLGVATALILRTLSRRWRSAGADEIEVPYGPSEPAPPAAEGSS